MIADIVSLACILVGALLTFAAACGIARFGDPMSRVHAVTKPQTSGLVLTLAGASLRVMSSPDFDVAARADLGLVILLIIFALFTSPVTAQRISRVARREGLYGPDSHMSRNDNPAPKRPGNSLRRS